MTRFDSGDGPQCPVEGHGRSMILATPTGRRPWCPVQVHDDTGGAWLDAPAPTTATTPSGRQRRSARARET
jgi:hypothetical protein